MNFPTTSQREAALLGPHAMRSADSRGRKHPEAEHPYRGPFQRDRDRILHCGAYRRLSGKMQVFTGEMGDYHRTRLTHTQEVASIARTLARALRLNEDLVEALALFHDIGHPPFGHAGEDALDECLAERGGFSHNRYALTIAEELEQRYPHFPGLNLTLEVLESQATRIDKSSPPKLLEAQVVDLADSITYDAHDTDDAVKLGLVTLEELSALPLVAETMHKVQERFGPLAGSSRRRAVVHELIDCQVSDLLEHAAAVIESDEQELVLRPGERIKTQKAELESFLYERVYRHPKLIKMRSRAQQWLHAMFAGFVAHPDWLPQKFQRRAETAGLEISVGDYLAGMTDRYCGQQYEERFA